mmetsp:Transcript_10365/g.18456  ORF Transcript_10365/g.18456 Transcript_10365/m.18456 type:complete len:585 (-) Transcript_10365:104-1858(-)
MTEAEGQTAPSGEALESHKAAAEWVEDTATEVCMNCHARFGLVQMRRRHHCRLCGKVVCSACSRSRQLVPEYHSLKPQRVCDACGPRGSITANTNGEEVEKAAAEAAKGKKVKPVSLDSLAGPVPSGDEKHREFGTLQVRMKEAKGLLAADFTLVTKKSSDPYCLLRIDHGPQVFTRTVGATLEPCWDASAAFRLSRKDAVLRVEVWDEDKVGADDPLGFLELPLEEVPSSACHSSFSGWVPLRLPEAEALPGGTAAEAGAAGAVFLEVSLGEIESFKHYLAYVAPLPRPPKPLPPFDIDAVYGPAMHVVDLVWSRFISPILMWFLGIVFWSRPLHSLVALVAWNVGARHFLQHYPAFLPFGLALFMFSNFWTCPQVTKAEDPVPKQHKKLTRAKTDGSLSTDKDADGQDVPHGDYDESQLGSAVQRLCFVLPAWVKELCQGLQPVLRTVADGLQMVHDIFVWDHCASPVVAAVLLAFAGLCEVLRFDILLMVLGSLVLIACSPLVPALTGTVAYARRSRSGQPKAWEMHAEYDEAWSSKDYRQVACTDASDAPSAASRGFHKARTLGGLLNRRKSGDGGGSRA